MDIVEFADRLWRGEISPADHHPWAATGPLVDVADGVGFLASFANVAAFRTADGLVLVDTGSPMTAAHVHRQIRGWTPDRLHTAIFSHGHIDHVFGVGPFENEDAGRPRVVAHRNVAARFSRYRLTTGYNAVINARQFGLDDLAWPTNYREPDLVYDNRLDLDVGGITFALQHARGETDDHTWTWVPSRRVLCTGDLFIWACPNAGNPQKVQRYPAEWAQALRSMAVLDAEVLLPGHGVPVIGADRVRQALTDTAAYLESLHDQTVDLMNTGAALDRILRTVRPLQNLAGRPYLQPIYDDPEFIVRNIWRLYGGWWDGDPSSLKPAGAPELAREVASLAGGPARLAARARELAESGNLRLAAHLAEFAARAEPQSARVHAVRADVYERRVVAEPSTMAKGIFAAAAAESRQRSGGGAP